MIRNRKNQSLFLILFFLISLTNLVTAQKHFEAGYVVLNNGDTLVGMVKDRTPDPFGKLYKKIRFKGEGKSKYGPDEILSYKQGDNLYESIGLEDAVGFLSQDYSIALNDRDAVFIKVKQRGPVTYYQLEFQDPDSSYYDYYAYFKKADGNELVRTTQGLFGLRKKKLASFFSDYPVLAEKILNGEFKYPNEVASFYNEWKRNQNQ